MGKKSGSGSGMNNPDNNSKSLETNFGLKYLNSLMRIRDGKNSDPRSGMKKIRIQDKHPGSATLNFIIIFFAATRFNAYNYVLQTYLVFHGIIFSRIIDQSIKEESVPDLPEVDGLVLLEDEPKCSKTQQKR
jgi:hypothetical protein